MTVLTRADTPWAAPPGARRLPARLRGRTPLTVPPAPGKRLPRAEG